MPNPTHENAPSDANEIRRIAVLRAREGDFDSAIEHFSRYLESSPDDAPVLRALGQIIAGQGDIAKGQTYLERALRIDPSDSSSHEGLANLHLEAGRHGDAIRAYQSAIDIDPSLGSAHNKLGVALYLLGRPDEARSYLEKAVEINAADADAHNNLGIVLASQGNAVEAVAHFETATTASHDWPPPHRNLGHVLAALGRNQEAISACREALRLDPGDSKAACTLAEALAAVGQTAEAIDVLEAACQERPDEPEPLFALGATHAANRDWERAITAFENVSGLLPGSPEILNNLAGAYLEVKRHDQAIEAANAAIAADATYVLSYNTLASCYVSMAMPQEALLACDKALQLDPKLFAAAYNRAFALRLLGRAKEARLQFEASLEMSPNSPEVYGGLASIHREAGEFDEAAGYYRQAMSLAPDHDEFVYHLAALLQYQNRSDDLIDEGRRLVENRPEFAPGYLLQSLGYAKQERFAEAEAVLLRALDFEPDQYQCLMALAKQYHSEWRLEEAATVFERILEFHPDRPEGLPQLVDIHLTLCDWRNYSRFSGELMERVRREIAAEKPPSVDVFSLQALPVDYAFIAEAARNKAKAYSSEQDWAKATTQFSFQISKRRRIRVGYVLPYTWFHSLPLVLKGVVERHDRERFEVYGYSLQPLDGSPFEQSYRQAFDQFQDLEENYPNSAARTINRDNLDILIDVAGQTAINAMSILSFRPAPVQAHYLGYSITTGAEYIDYLITDNIYIPQTLEEHCSEALVRLPDTFMATIRAPISREPTRRADHGLPDDAFVLCNFNHPCKFEPDIFGAWMRIMARIPNSVLWFGDWSAATRKNLRIEAEARGITGDRLIFAPIKNHAEHCERLKHADLAVDPFHHGGGITTVDALWCGVPVVTACGETPSSRLGASLLTAAELPDTITHSLSEYEDLAISLSNDAPRLQRLRERLWDGRTTSPLFDTKRYVRNLERAYEAMVRRHRDGQPPANIKVEAGQGRH